MPFKILQRSEPGNPYAVEETVAKPNMLVVEELAKDKLLKATRL
jgi:hypothetical protein